MDAVLAHTPSGHHHQIAGLRLFFIKFPAVMFQRHHADRAGKYERFTSVAVVEPAPSLRRGDARAVAPDTNAPDYAVKDLAGGEDRVCAVFPPEQYRVRIRVTDAVPVEIDAGFCPEPKADRVPVHPDNAGQGTAKRVKGRWGVVGLDLVGHQVVVIKDDGAGIIRKHRHADVVVTFLLSDCIGGCLDIGLIEPVRDIIIHG